MKQQVRRAQGFGTAQASSAVMTGLSAPTGTRPGKLADVSDRAAAEITEG